MSNAAPRGFMRSMWNYFTKIRPSRKQALEKIVGTDLSGNKYVLKPGDPNTGRREVRHILPTEESAMMYTERLGLNIPQEWDAWLRHRRDDPPTLEELERNELQKLKIQERVRELDMKARLEKSEESSQIDGESLTEDRTATRITETISGDTRKAKFPVYSDLENDPGQFHRPVKD